MDRYVLKRGELQKDAPKLRPFFNAVFAPENVGNLAENLFRHFPGMEGRYWFIAEDRESGKIAAACALLPWKWQMEGISLKVAEMGIVGTGEEHRGQGLMRRLHGELMKTVEEEHFDLVVIQGIPGFYDRLGFRYALPLCSHVELPLHAVPSEVPETLGIRSAGIEDIPFLMEEDRIFAAANSISAPRDGEHWQYLLTRGQETEYGSDFLIFQHSITKETSYVRISRHGFGRGLIISEASEGISRKMGLEVLSHCGRLAVERQKPYLRLDLHPEAPLSRIALASGATAEEPYAWQVTIPDERKLLLLMAPLLEKRLERGMFRRYSGKVRLDFFQHSLDLIWSEGKLRDISPGNDLPCDAHFCVHKELFPALCLGHRSRGELRRNRPDIFPALSHVGSRTERVADITGMIIDELFPARRSWIYEQY